MKLYFIVDSKNVPRNIGDGRDHKTAYANQDDALFDAEGLTERYKEAFRVQEVEIPETFLRYFGLKVHNPPVRHRDYKFPD